MCFVILGSIHMNQDEAAIAVGLAMACLGFQILPLSKLTRQRRYGFYRETMRPLAIAICAASMGGAVGPLTSTHMSNDETAVALGFIVVPLVFAFFFLLVRGSPPPSNTNYARPAGRAPENRDRLA